MLEEGPDGKTVKCAFRPSPMAAEMGVGHCDAIVAALSPLSKENQVCRCVRCCTKYWTKIPKRRPPEGEGLWWPVLLLLRSCGAVYL